MKLRTLLSKVKVTSIALSSIKRVCLKGQTLFHKNLIPLSPYLLYNLIMSPFELQFLPEGAKRPLLAAAANGLSTQGLYKFSLGQVAKEAQVSRPHLNYHYKTIEPLFLDLLMAWGKSGQTVTNEHLASKLGDTPVDLLFAIVDATFYWHKKCPTYAKMTPTLIHLSSQFPQLAVAMNQVTQHGQMRMRALLEKELSLKKSSTTLSKSIHMSLIGGLLYYLGTAKTSEKEVVSSIKQTISKLCDSAR